MGILYIVATPIGNMEDITLRAIRVLGEVEIIACEDTRKTGMLIQKLKIKKPKLISYYEENEVRRVPEIIQLLKEGNKVALVSNAGTPTLSDPGFKLVRLCWQEGIKVETIPGPSSVIASLVSSGLPTDKFLFLGYLPKKSVRRKKMLENCLQLPFSCTLIFFESPFRLLASLKDIKAIFGDIEIVVANELTKMFEKIHKEKIPWLISFFEKSSPRGEFVILFSSLPDPGSG